MCVFIQVTTFHRCLLFPTPRKNTVLAVLPNMKAVNTSKNLVIMHGFIQEMNVTFIKLRKAVKLDAWHDSKLISYVRSKKPGRKQTDMRLQEITQASGSAQSLYRQKYLFLCNILCTVYTQRTSRQDTIIKIR